MADYRAPGVFVEEVQSGSQPIEGVGTAVAAFLGLAEKGKFNEPVLVTNWGQFTKNFGEFVDGAYLAHSVYGFFQNGGGTCYVIRVGGNGSSNGNGHAASLPAAHAELVASVESGAVVYRVTALEPGPQANDLIVEVADPAEGQPTETFQILVKRGDTILETHSNLSTKRGRQNAVTQVAANSKLITLEEVTTGGTLERPASGTVTLTGGAADLGASVPAVVTQSDYTGDVAQRTGVGGLEALDAVTMVCAPDLMAAHEQIGSEAVIAVQQEMMQHCERMGDRVAIIDPPPNQNADEIHRWRIEHAAFDNKYAALYWPWIKVMHPRNGKTMMVPPSGHIAGIWSRNDDERGVHKAPANEVVRGAIGLETQITKNEQALLNPDGINCLRAFPGRGIRVWGARTLSKTYSEWKYLNVRRLFNYLEESILDGTQWAVFEPNDEALWAKMRRTITAFLSNEWRKGALFGATPQEAFYVKCDAENNPPEQIDLGQVVCEIGIAPVKPAEFVIFRLAQFSGGAAVTE